MRGNLGNVLLGLRQTAAAIVSYRRALELDPQLDRAREGLATAHYELGNALNDLDRADEAIASYRDAIRFDPGHVNAHCMLGNLLKEGGQLQDALGCYRRMVEIEPRSVLAYNNMGTVLGREGRLEEAAGCFRKAIEFSPSQADAYVNLGDMSIALGELDAAVASYTQALFLSPGSPVVQFALGNALFAQGKPDEAIVRYRSAIELKPDFAEAHANLGNAFRHQGRQELAIVCYERALALKPDFPEAHSNLGNVLLDQGRLDAAATCYRRALDLKPDFPEARNNLGDALKSKGLLEEAIKCYEAAIRLRPSFPEAHFHLGNALLDQDRVDEALDCYLHAVSLRPDYAEARWSIVAAQVPAVYGIDADPALYRRAFSAELDKLIDWFAAARTVADPGCVRIQTPFYLAYQEEDNRELRSRHGSLCTRMMGQWLARQSLPARERRNSGGVIRIGIVSQHFCKHSVWSAIIKGWFQQLDRKRFSLHAFYLGSARDQETLFAQSRAAHFVQGSRGLRQWVEAIAGQQPDVLIYPEIGMDSMTGRLACLRLAPVQVSTWGHPETTGLPNIDYYLSAERLEPESAQESYSERLVKLPGLGCYYDLYEIDAVTPDLAQWGSEPGTPVLLCPGTPFKYAPQRDWILAEITRRLGRCRLIFFTYGDFPTCRKNSGSVCGSNSVGGMSTSTRSPPSSHGRPGRVFSAGCSEPMSIWIPSAFPASIPQCRRWNADCQSLPRWAACCAAGWPAASWSTSTSGNWSRSLIMTTSTWQSGWGATPHIACMSATGWQRRGTCSFETRRRFVRWKISSSWRRRMPQFVLGFGTEISESMRPLARWLQRIPDHLAVPSNAWILLHSTATRFNYPSLS
ncbi:MAG: tetratricopeptide repeat protein [Betaproteobacteria bacterium]|nr:tetratricopeptide repeat protein [Betaproteobacteria bacterium]